MTTRVGEYGDHYTNIRLRAKNIAQSPKYIDKKGLIFIRNAFNAMDGYSAGECGDIASALDFRLDYLGVKDEFARAGVHIVSASGLEPIFFNKEGLNHVFLVIYKGKPDIVTPAILDPTKCIIIDPAMQKVVHYPDSGYSIKVFNFEWKRYIDGTIYLNKANKDEALMVQGKDMLLLGLTKDRKHTVTMHYQTINGKNFPVVAVQDREGNRASLYIDPETQQFISNVGRNLPDVTPQTNDELEEVLKTLQNPTFKPITKDGEMEDYKGNKYLTYFDEEGAPIKSSFTKKID